MENRFGWRDTLWVAVAVLAIMLAASTWERVARIGAEATRYHSDSPLRQLTLIREMEAEQLHRLIRER